MQSMGIYRLRNSMRLFNFFFQQQVIIIFFIKRTLDFDDCIYDETLTYLH